MQSAGAASAASILNPQTAGAAAAWPLPIGDGIPKICAYAGGDAAANRALLQLGVNHVIGRGGREMPWTE